MTSRPPIRFLSACLLVATWLAFPLGATPLAPSPALDITGQGLSVATGGVGLENTQMGTITVDIGGPVAAAALYWVGRDSPCDEDMGGACIVGKDDELLFGGVPIVADAVVGEEVNLLSGGGQTNNIGYFADVTPIVAPAGTGMQSFTIADNDPEDLYRLNGAGLLVIYVDPTDDAFYRVVVYEGLDFAYINAQPAAAKVTDPVAIPFAPAAVARSAEVTIFAGDAEPDRPDRIDLNGASVLNSLDADDGGFFDADSYVLNVPAGDDEVTLQLFSEQTGLGTTPDSMLWAVGSLRIPVEGAVSGRMTGGGGQIRVDGVRITRGFTIHCDITLSNNIEINWSGGNKWHLDKPITKAMCIDDPAFDPVPPAAPFDTFIGEAVGSLNGTDGSVLHFTFVDDGEPGTSDRASIEIWAPGDDPSTDTPVLSVSGLLDHGNFQAHFDQPHG
jgi:hypothetical protein